MLEVTPISDPVYYTGGISETVPIIMEPSSEIISHIAKDSSDFKKRPDKHSLNRTASSIRDTNDYALTFGAIFFIQLLDANLIYY